MSIEERNDILPATIGPRIFLAIEQVAQNVYRARSLPPLKIDEMGSSEKQLLSRVRAILPAHFRKMSAAMWARPMPGNNAQLTSPHIKSYDVPLTVKSLRENYQITLPIDVIQWQVDERNVAFFVPNLDLTIVGKESVWIPTPFIKELQAEIERKCSDFGLEAIYDLLVGKHVRLHSIRFPASTVINGTAPTRQVKKTQTPNLKKTSSDVREWVRDPVFERDDLVDQVAAVLTATIPQSVLLVGPAGVGKTSIVQHLPKRTPQMPPLWSTGGSQLVSGMCGWGMWQEQLHKVLSELKKIEGILHVGSLFELVEAGKIEDQPGVASLLKPEIQRGRIRVIAECTPEQYQQLESQDPALIRCFTRIDIDELTQAANIKVLQHTAQNLLKIKQSELSSLGNIPTEIALEVIQELDQLCRRYCGYSVMPGVPLRLLKSIIGSLRDGDGVTNATVLHAFSTHTGLPRFLIDNEVPLDYQDLTRKLNARVIGQKEPVELISDMITTLKTRLQRPEKPLASFLFIGPTGVGKTEMAKTVAEVLFGNSQRMVRLDMSEYATPWSLARLTGTSIHESGTLTGPILDQPFSLVLLDEIEKAHPSIFDLLLQVLGEGRLTDTAGRKADFRSSVIIMTSNLGVETFKAVGTGFGGEKQSGYREHFEREVRRYVRPELLGRLDRIVPFATLSREHVREIAEREVYKLWQRPGIRYGKWSVKVDSEVLNLVAERGYQPQYGARPLRRVIEESIAIPLAAYMLEASAANQDHGPIQRIHISLKNQEIVINRVEEHEETSIGSGEGSDQGEYSRTQADLVDQWRELRYKAQLSLRSPEMRSHLGLLDRCDRFLENIDRKIRKCADPERMSALIATQGSKLSERKQIIKRLDDVQKAATDIERIHLLVLKAYYKSESIPAEAGVEDARTHEALLRSGILGLADEHSQSRVWTIMYMGSAINDFKFLIEVHASRFNAKGAFWLLYDLKKFNKMKREESHPNPYNEKDVRIWSDAEIVAVRHSKNLNEVSVEQAIGLAFEALPSQQRVVFIEEEQGTHILKKRDAQQTQKYTMKVHLFPQDVSSLSLPAGFRKMQFPSEVDPLREYFQTEGKMTHLPTKTVVPIGAGSLAIALQGLLQRIEDDSVWSQIGFKGLPDSTKTSSSLF